MWTRLPTQPIRDGKSTGVRDHNMKTPLMYWNYDAVGLILANPPFSELDRVIAKSHRDGAKMVLISPDWKSTDYYKKMWQYAQRYHYYDQGTDFFGIEGRSSGPTRWGVWAVYIDATEQKSQDNDQKNRRRRQVQRQEGNGERN